MADDVLAAFVNMLAIMSEMTMSLADIIPPLRIYQTSGEINRRVADPDALLEALALEHARAPIVTGLMVYMLAMTTGGSTFDHPILNLCCALTLKRKPMKTWFASENAFCPVWRHQGSVNNTSFYEPSIGSAAR